MENIALIERLKEEGYKYAEYWYSNWYDEFIKDIDDDDDSWYKDSLDENGNPTLEKFEEQIMEQVNHQFYSYAENNQEALQNLDIKIECDGIEELDTDEIFDTIVDGIIQFQDEHYEEK